MGTNGFLPFAASPGSNVITDSQYASAAARQLGFSTGRAPSNVFNKAQLQSSVAAAVFGQFITDWSGLDTNDSLPVGTLEANYRTALAAAMAGAFYAADTSGTANVMTGALNPAPPILNGTVFLAFWLKVGNTNTGAATLALNSFGPKSVLRSDGSPVLAGDLTQGITYLFYWDGSAFRFSAASRSERIGRQINVQVFSAAGTYTYTPTAGTNFVRVRALGAGAAGGGAPATSGTNMGLGAPGSAGAYAVARILSGFAGQTIIVGAAGLPVAGSSGGNGGTSSFGALVVAPGGFGGPFANPSPSGIGVGGQQSAQPTFGSGAIIEINAAGAPGGVSLGINASNGAYGAQGGPSVFGGGGSAAPSNVNGQASRAAGAGGGGTATTNGYTSPLLGGAGADGLVVVEEFA